MALSDMKIFQDFTYRAATETLKQNVDAFNEASGNAIRLETAANVGDFANNASFAAIGNLMRRRDAYGSGSLTPTQLAQMNEAAVKVAGGTNPVEFAPSQFSWLAKNPEEAGVVIGEQVAKGILADQLNSTVLSLQAAMGGNTDVAHTATDATLNLQALNKGASRFGDQMMSLAAWVIHSKPMTDLFDGALQNANGLFEFGSVRIMQDGFGRRFVMIDSPALVEVDGVAAGTDAFKTIGLVEGGAVVQDNADLYSTIEEKTGNENILRIFQAEYSHNIALKGYGYVGTKSPNDATLGSSANWEQVASDVKSTAGVIITTR